MDHPNRGQVDVPLIRVDFGAHERWYDLGCETCSPGEVRPGLRGESVLRYTPEILTLHDNLIEGLANSSAMLWADNYLQAYYARVSAQDWIEWVSVPGDPQELAGVVEVSCSYLDASCSSALVSVESAGMTSLRYEAHQQDSAAEAFGSWANRHLERMDSYSVETESESVADTLQLELSVEFPPIAPPTGDAWVLPAELVYGTPILGEWPEERELPFYVPRTLSRRWTLEIPLPEGWEDAEVPPEQDLGVDVLNYRVEYKIVDAKLVITRELFERKSNVDDAASLSLIGDQARAIHDLETSPVVLTRKELGK
jgi:hypothetical protein